MTRAAMKATVGPQIPSSLPGCLELLVFLFPRWPIALWVMPFYVQDRPEVKGEGEPYYLNDALGLSVLRLDKTVSNDLPFLLSVGWDIDPIRILLNLPLKKSSLKGLSLIQKSDNGIRGRRRLPFQGLARHERAMRILVHRPKRSSLATLRSCPSSLSVR